MSFLKSNTMTAGASDNLHSYAGPKITKFGLHSDIMASEKAASVDKPAGKRAVKGDELASTSACVIAVEK